MQQCMSWSDTAAEREAGDSAPLAHIVSQIHTSSTLHPPSVEQFPTTLSLALSLSLSYTTLCSVHFVQYARSTLCLTSIPEPHCQLITILCPVSLVAAVWQQRGASGGI
jgi:hypothetical protein